MAEIYRVPDLRADSGSHEPVIASPCANFRKAAQLRPTEVSAGMGIEGDACGKQKRGRSPGSARRIERQVTPRPRQSCYTGPHHDPGGNQNAERRWLALSPAARSWMDHQPAQGDGGIEQPGQPRERAHETHAAILQTAMNVVATSRPLPARATHCRFRTSLRPSSAWDRTARRSEEHT